MLNNQQKLTIMHSLINDDLTLTEQVDLLMQLPIASLTGKDLANFVRLLLTHAQLLSDIPTKTADIVGTGGDGKNYFNISTTAAFIAAACGITIAKHGNRAVTSQVGSFDCLASLGINYATDPSTAQQQLLTQNITFLYGPAFHPILKKFHAARQLLATKHIKTLFNVIAPLLNPARPCYQFIGVYDKLLIEPMINALQMLEVNAAIVIHGNGSDEAHINGTNYAAKLINGNVSYFEFNAFDYGLEVGDEQKLHGGDPPFNAMLCQQIIAGKLTGPAYDIVLLNAALLLHLAHPDKPDLTTAINLARLSITQGHALKILQNLQKSHARVTSRSDL